MPKTDKSTQDRFLELCSNAAREYGRDPVIDYRFANVGRFSVLEEGTLKVLFSFEFDFQQDPGRGVYVTLDRLPGRSPTRASSDEYFSADRLPEALKRVRDELARIRQQELMDELQEGA
jgi:hypothetical protein